jgi:PAS domain S-box-containing protein
MDVSSETDQWVSHTHQVLEVLRDLQGGMERVESSYRGFALTGQESFLASYRAGARNVGQNEADIRSLTADNASQKPRLEHLHTLAVRKIRFADMVIGIRRAQGLAAAADAIRSGIGQQVQDEFEGVVREIRDEERRLLLRREAASILRLRQAKSILILGTILALAMGAAAVWSVQRENAARRIAEKEQREGEERFRTIANNISQLAWMADAHSSVIWYNQRWFDYTGMTFEEMADGGRQKVLHPDHFQRVVEKIDRCFRIGEVWEDTFPLLGKDGNYRWFLSRAVPIRDAGGNVSRWFGTNTDVTASREAEKEALRNAVERKEMEEALFVARERVIAERKLRESEASFRRLADAMPQIVFTAQPDGSFDYFNQRWYDYTGLTFEESKDGGWKSVAHPHDLPRRIDLWSRAISTGEPFEDQCRFRRKVDGVYRWHLGRALPIVNSEGKIEGWFGTCTDIEDYKRAEAENRQLNEQLESRVSQRTAELETANGALKNSTDRLERSNRDLQDFATVASHDLQEPLRKVQVFGSRLKKNCGPLLDAQGQDYLERMLNAGRRMQTLVEDLLAFSRVTSQARPFVEVDLSVVTQEVLSDLEVRIAETGARVQLGELPTIDADPAQIRQLLQNLIGNALKFHKKEQAPVIRIYAASTTQDGFFRLMVEDDGIGFDEKYLDRIFTVFQRLHGRAEYEGTGIGLAVCRKIAHRHGGEITAISAPGKGATFVVTLRHGAGIRQFARIADSGHASEPTRFAESEEETSLAGRSSS